MAEDILLRDTLCQLFHLNLKPEILALQLVYFFFHYEKKESHVLANQDGSLWIYSPFSNTYLSSMLILKSSSSSQLTSLVRLRQCIHLRYFLLLNGSIWRNHSSNYPRYVNNGILN